MEAAESKCKAILLFTDGISDDIVDTEGFARSFVDYCCSLPVSATTVEVMSMLSDWPTPKHSDDKTIACLFKKDY